MHIRTSHGGTIVLTAVIGILPHSFGKCK
jgi:hypothetical protein